MPRRSGHLVARLAAVTLAAASLVAIGASGGSAGPLPSGVFSVPAGHTVTFVEPYMTACNQLEWGYVIEGQSDVVVDQFPGGCGDETFASTTIGPFTEDVMLRVFLTDVSCGATYYSDGTPVDHVSVSPVGLHWHVEFADAGGNCETETTPSEGGNLQLDVNIDPAVVVQKVVTGDDPGVAFPIVVSCTAAGSVPGSVEAAAEPEIVLGGPDATDAAQVELANGESATIPVVLDSPYIDTVTCTVTESLAGVALPEGYTCADPVVDHPEVVWNDEGWSATPVTVTNACTRAVEVQPTFTG